MGIIQKRELKSGLRRALWTALLPLHRITFATRGNPLQPAPKRILLLNGAHFGDVIISTGMLPVLRSAFPAVEIGFATGSWAQVVIQGHPEITYTHRIDDWRLNRSAAPAREKREQCRRARLQFLREIKEIGYDWAIFLHWRPDCIDLTWRAGIPFRAAFRQNLLAFFATHGVRCSEGDTFLTEGARQVRLLRALGVEEPHLRLRKACLPESDAAAVEELEAIFRQQDLTLSRYCLVHIGAAAPARELPLRFWRELVDLLPRDTAVVFTGQGDREAKNISALSEGLKNCINACGKLSWKGLVEAVRHAGRVYSVDTSIVHIAAAVGTPIQVVATGINGVARWRPDCATATVWTNHVSCSPCLQQNGCPEMTCLRGILPTDLLKYGDGGE